MGGVLANGDIQWAVERDKREVRQVDLMFLVESCLACVRIRSRLLLHDVGVQSMVAVEVDVEAVRWDLVTGYQGGVISIVGETILELGNVIGARLPTCQERAEERTRGIVLDVELHADGLHILLQDQFVISAPQVVGRRRVLELQVLPILRANAIRSLDPSIRIQHRIGRGRIIGRTRCIGLVARNIGLPMIGTQRRWHIHDVRP